MISENINILLADDDMDDCMFFKDALEEIQLATQFTAVHDGEQLMHYLNEKTDELPHVLFLDLNMPRKNGFACLEEIKSNEKLQSIPVIILSTSFHDDMANELYKNGAHFYICKPSDFSQLKKLIHKALTFTRQDEHSRIMQPPKEKFLLK